MLRIEPGTVAHDNAFPFQAADALGAGCGRQADPLAQFGKGQPALGLQLSENLSIDAVQFSLGSVFGSHWGICLDLRLIERD
ncbi:hypothetical protein GCM10009083_10790 [Halopseudomonas pertucinogena]|uniref:Uncharacterized protein n=1 Tax=Halopseudomonas pertucinogena TaxID=86175 RepID=A0ABQ2CR99_9GAMM|nr:hypothetical protein GCM10009083_10790 [Halopseudomonas pertucinogena]